MYKFLALFLVFIGESLSVMAELRGAWDHDHHQSFGTSWLKMFLIITIAGGFLIAGYILGYRAYKNIWIISAASLAFILIVEPVLVYFMFGQSPTTGALIGWTLGILGLIATLTL